MLIMLVICVLPMLMLEARAQEQEALKDVDCEEMSDFAYYACETISNVIPILVLGGVLFLVYRSAANKNKPNAERYQQYMERSQQHMDRVEEKYDRLINLLEEVIEKRE
jgi:hypothetical protein